MDDCLKEKISQIRIKLNMSHLFTTFHAAGP